MLKIFIILKWVKAHSTSPNVSIDRMRSMLYELIMIIWWFAIVSDSWKHNMTDYFPIILIDWNINAELAMANHNPKQQKYFSANKTELSLIFNA